MIGRRGDRPLWLVYRSRRLLELYALCNSPATGDLRNAPLPPPPSGSRSGQGNSDAVAVPGAAYRDRAADNRHGAPAWYSPALCLVAMFDMLSVGLEEGHPSR